MFVAPILLIVIDIGRLTAHPWVNPSEPEMLGQFERLSPIVESFVESPSQGLWQCCVPLRSSSLGRQRPEVRESLKVLVCSIVFLFCGMAWKTYNLCQDAKAVDLPLQTCALELVRGPLGMSPPFLTILKGFPDYGRVGCGITRSLRV